MFDWISNLFKPAADLVDNLHVSEEERGELRNKLMEVQGKIHSQVTDLMKTEATSQHFIVAAWRPITSIILVTILFCDAFGFIQANDKLFSLAEMFLGVYAGSRGFEKIFKASK